MTINSEAILHTLLCELCTSQHQLCNFKNNCLMVTNRKLAVFVESLFATQN